MELELRKKELDTRICNIMTGKEVCDIETKNNLIEECRKVKIQIKGLKENIIQDVKPIRKKVCKILSTCHNCKIEFNGNKILYCELCYTLYKNNAIEIIY